MKPIDTCKLVQNTYDHIASKYHQRYKQYSEFLLRSSREFIKLLPKNARILDIGCGSGRDAKFFDQQGFEVIAVDFSPAMLKIAKKVAPKVKFILSDFRNLKLPENYLDGIWSYFSLLHLKRGEIPSLLSSLNKILKNNGILFLATQEGQGEVIEPENLDNHFRIFETFYSKEELSRLVKKAKFKIIEARTDCDRVKAKGGIVVIFGQK